MALTAAQLGLCLQSYWYMWLTNGLSALLFIGIDIGVAAFFMAKFHKSNSKNYLRPASVKQRPLTPIEINNLEEPSRQSASRRSGTRSNTTLLNDSAEDNEDFAQTTCHAINMVRQQYDAPPVELDDQLSVIAQDWANQMAQSGKLEHRPLEYRNFGRKEIGENLATVYQKELTAHRMVKIWLKQGRSYKFGTDGTRSTNNFTQLVWQGSREVGVGRARSEDGNWWYGVVVFDPPGNIPSQYAQNVKFPTS